MLDRGFLILGLCAFGLTAASLAFACLALGLRLRHQSRRLEWERMTRAWEPALLDVLSGAAPPEALHGVVPTGDGPAFLTFLLHYVRRLRGEEQAVARDLAEPYLPSVMPMLRRGTPESRGNAVMLLARMGMPRYADLVARALADPSPRVAMLAAHSLLHPEHERHFPAVVEHLPRLVGWSRSFLAGMLKAAGPGVATHLRPILADREAPAAVRAVCGDALRGLNDLESAAVAYRVLADETDRDVAASCLRILQQLGDTEHLSEVRTLAHAHDDVIRARAIAALGALGGEEDVPLVRERVHDASFWVSLEATRALVALGQRDQVEAVAASQDPRAVLARQVLAE